MHSSAVLALAASKARDIPPFPALDHPQESPSSSSGAIETPLKIRPTLELEHAVLPAATFVSSSMPATVDNSAGVSASKSTKGGGKAKMRPGPAKNGRNLCAHRWRKQVQSSGSTEEFQNYYNGLSSVQRVAYDNEAIALVSFHLKVGQVLMFSGRPQAIPGTRRVSATAPSTRLSIPASLARSHRSSGLCNAFHFLFEYLAMQHFTRMFGHAYSPHRIAWE